MPAPAEPKADRSKTLWSALGAVALVLISVALTYVITSRLNNQTAVQQQQAVSLQEYNRTGAAIDVAVTNLSDAIVSGSGVGEARQNARKAIAEHVGASLALAEVVGRENMNAYMEGVSRLRELVDDSRNPRSAMLASQARLDLMQNRETIAAEARRNIYS